MAGRFDQLRRRRRVETRSKGEPWRGTQSRLEKIVEEEEKGRRMSTSGSKILLFAHRPSIVTLYHVPFSYPKC